MTIESGCAEEGPQKALEVNMSTLAARCNSKNPRLQKVLRRPSSISTGATLSNESTTPYEVVRLENMSGTLRT